jgi:hypothetical protein
LRFCFGAAFATSFFVARGAPVAGLPVAGFFAADFAVRVGVRAFNRAAFEVLPAIPPSRVTLRWAASLQRFRAP